jgi:hypothetical protein
MGFSDGTGHFLEVRPDRRTLRIAATPVAPQGSCRGHDCNAAIANALLGARCAAFAAQQNSVVANPSYAAYTWVFVGVEVLIFGMPFL